MKIGIDIDGVILNSENVFDCKAELYDLLELHKNGVTNKEGSIELEIYEEWTQDDLDNFRKKYLIECTKKSELMPFAKEVLDLLRNDGHEFIIITARGGFIKEMKTAAENKFKEYGLEFDKYYWAVEDKLEICKKENIDIMIDDRATICKAVSESKIRTLYFRDVNRKKLEENEYLKEVNNWGEIYRYIYNLNLKEN